MLRAPAATLDGRLLRMIDGFLWWWFEMQHLRGWIASRIVVARLRMRNLVKQVIDLRFLNDTPINGVDGDGVL